MVQLTVIHNPDESKIILYKIARLIYAETGGASLRVVESLASMIANLVAATGRNMSDIADDANIFESLNENSAQHHLLSVDAKNRGFEMCVRVVQKMLNGNLADCCYGATKFHRVEMMPKWAIARGYIAEVDNLLFYL